MTARTPLLFIFLTSLLLTGCFEQEQDKRGIELTPKLEAARNKAMVLCAGCHGPEGIGTAAFNPNLACQKKIYMVKQLNDYRTGKRNNHIPMVNIAKMLTDEEVDSISEWYSQLNCPAE